MSIVDDFKKTLNERSVVTSLLSAFSVFLSAFIIVSLRGMEVISVWTAGMLTFILPVVIYLIGTLWLILEIWRLRAEITKGIEDTSLLPEEAKLWFKRLP